MQPIRQSGQILRPGIVGAPVLDAGQLRRAGTIHGLLGPNGSGKTTTVRMLATLLRPDAGTAHIFGHDVSTDAHAVRQLISVTRQYASVDEALSATENLVIFARLLGLGPRDARRRAAELLEEFDLTEVAGRSLGTFSGGMRRRLDLAAGLIVRPPLLFLDEPTTGLDPRNRARMWSTIRGLVAQGSTVLLTTQYLDEADQFAERIMVIDRGRVIAEDTPDGLKASVVRSVLLLRPEDRADLDRVRLRAETILGTPGDRVSRGRSGQRAARNARRGDRSAHRPRPVTCRPSCPASSSRASSPPPSPPWTGLREEMKSGVFDRFRSLPIARIAPLAGVLLVDTLPYCIAATTTFLAGFALGYRPDGGIPATTGG